MIAARVCAETVVSIRDGSARSTEAETHRSRSVARTSSRLPSALSSRFDRIGSVLRRSVTPASAFSAPRSAPAAIRASTVFTFAACFLSSRAMIAS
jgi:hypothetical protein